MAVAITQTANPAGAASSPSVTYSAVSIGTASADRIVCVCVANGKAATISSCTIDSGGGAQTMNGTTQGSQGAVGAKIFYLGVSSGTTADIAVTYSTDLNEGQNHIAVYSVTGADATPSASGSDASTDMDATDPLTTGSTTINTDGGALAVASCDIDTVAKTWADLTEDIDDDVGVMRFTTATSITAGTATRTCTGATNGEDGGLAYIIFNAAGAATGWPSQYHDGGVTFNNPHHGGHHFRYW